MCAELQRRHFEDLVQLLGAIRDITSSLLLDIPLNAFDRNLAELSLCHHLEVRERLLHKKRLTSNLPAGIAPLLI